MEGLSDQIKVPVKRVNSHCIWSAPNHLEKLNDLNVLLDKKFRQNSTSAKESFSHLGLLSDPIRDIFLTPEHWNDFVSNKVTLSVEKFHDPYGPDLGPGRNVNLEGFQYKGIGRNHASLRDDFIHSWGGMTLTELAVEVIMEQMLDRVAPDKSVPIYGGFRFEDSSTGFLIRSSSFLRCSQTHPNFYEHHKNILRKKICDALEAEEGDCYLKIVRGFCRLYKMGFIHFSPTSQNITVDGRFLDHYSLEYAKPSQTPFFSIDIASSYGPSIDQIVQKAFTLKGTSVHLLEICCKVVHRSFQSLGFRVPELDRIWDIFAEYEIDMFGTSGGLSLTERAVSDYLKNFDPNSFHVEVLSPENYRISTCELLHRPLVRSTHKLFDFYKKFNEPIDRAQFSEILNSLTQSFAGRQ